MTRTTNRDRLIDLLRELFQLNQPDLDFGLYRILNARAAEIERFLSDDLLRIVEEAFAGSAEDRAQEAKAAYEATLTQAKEFGVADPDASPKVKEAREAYEAAKAAGGDEADVYDDLYRFFERYYDEGDFLSRRYYARETADRAAPYAVPYDGSEVYFHWANKDQYYIKTTENFRAFTFDAASALDDDQQRLFADEDAPLRVHLRVVDAAEGEHNNVKADEGKDRVYVIAETPIAWEGDELVVRFQYRPDPEKKGQAGKWRETRNEEAVEAVLDALGSDEHPQAAAYRQVLTREVRRGKDGRQPLLLRYVTRFTARNTMDYFIHKDLGGFLRRELDFYVKNEVMRLDDLEAADAPRVATYLAKVRVLRRIAHAVIDFLAQTEDFQKRLWLKKKFVVETQYCLTLDRLPKAFYPEIAAHDAQREEWVRLFAIEETEQELTRPGYSAPLTVEFLEANPYLVLDTALFDQDFTARLLGEIENLDSQCDGVLIHAENSQALRLSAALLAKRVDATYIDPPYNTVHSKIAYKNAYEHSSWLSLINNTLPLLRNLWGDQFSFGLAIDDYEFTRLSALLDSTFPGLEKSTVVVNHHPQGAGGRLSRTHEYYILLSRSDAPTFLGAPKDDEEEKRSFMRSGKAENNYRYGRWQSFYALLVDPGTRKIVGVEDPIPLDEPYPTVPTEEGLIRVYPINSQKEERVWRSSYKTGRKRVERGELVITPKKGTVYQLIDHQGKRETLFSNWTDSAFNAGIHGTQVLGDLGLGGIFDYPKSIHTMETAIWAQTFGNPDALVLDYFAGSGTTGHAVININRHQEFELSYVLVDAGHYFDTVLKPRIQKAIYSKDWKDGKPVGREGVSHCFKYLRLESYEDTLNNLVLADDEAAKQRQRAIADSEGLRHDYWLRYWLDLETRGSASLLSAEHFADPDGYWLTVKRPGSDEQTPQRVDLVETFNWLIGLHVIRLRAPETFAPEFERPADPELPGEDNTRLAVNDALEPAEEGPWRLRAVEGWVARTPGSDVERQNVLVVWRTLTGNVEQDDAVLEAYLRERLGLDLERADGAPYEVIYVNGSPTLLKWPGVEVRPLEPEFHRRMWDIQDV